MKIGWIASLLCVLFACAAEELDDPALRTLPYTLSGPAGVTQGVCSYQPFVLTRKGTTTLQLGLSLTNGQVYKDAACSQVMSSVSLTTTASFYVKSTSPGAQTVKVSGAASLQLGVAVYRAINVRTSAVTARAKGDDRSNDSIALEDAISYASKSLGRDYPDGPLGKQAIVYVPRGTYRIRNVELAANVRLEIDAGAVFKHCTSDSNCLAKGGATTTDQLFKLDAPVPTSATDSSHPPLRNVSIVGVGRSVAGKSNIAAGWDVSHSFTIDVDPAATGCSPQVGGILLRYVEGVELANIYSIGNNTTNPYKNPLVKFKASEDSTKAKDGSGLYAPRNVTYQNHYHVHASQGGGCVQLQAARDVVLSKLYAEGDPDSGAVRLETDAVGDVTLHSHGCESLSHLDQQGPDCSCTEAAPCALDYFSELDGLLIEDTVSKGGLGGVLLIPHNQQNRNITIVRASKVYGPGRGDRDKRLPVGGFFDYTITP